MFEMNAGKVCKFAFIVFMAVGFTKSVIAHKEKEDSRLQTIALQLELDRVEEEIQREIKALAFKERLSNASDYEIGSILRQCQNEIVESLRKESFGEPYIIDEYSSYDLLIKVNERSSETENQRVDYFMSLSDKDHYRLNLTYDALISRDSLSGVEKRIVTRTCVLDDRIPEFEIMSVLQG